MKRSSDSSITRFFISVIMTWISEFILIQILSRTWYNTTSIALSLFISGLVGGLLAKNPLTGAFAGFLGGVSIFGTIIVDGNPFWWLYLPSFFGGLSGGLLMNFHRVREAVENPETGKEAEPVANHSDQKH
jgi:hypothetical protein